MDVESLAKQLILQNMTPEQQQAVLESVRATLQEARGKQKQRVSENVGMVVDALKKIEADIRAKYDDLGNKITARVNSIRDGRDGTNGSDGRDGQDGRPGRDGAQGPAGPAGRDGANGVDGKDGVSVTDAKIDFDGSLIISLSNGREINVGEVVAPDLAEKIKVITNGGGTSQYVLDTLASLQTQINNLIPSQTGNAGKFLTTNGSALSWASVAGGLNYQGTWNASTNTPTLASSIGTSGYYYIVATAGSTNLDGITDWQIGDWLLFNGTAWQKIDQSELVTSVASADSSITVTTTGTAVDLATYSSPRLIAQVRNETGATLAKGTVVYISGASGNKATVSKALATSDTTSAQTFGVIQADIANNNNGYAILAGNIDGLDTSAFAAGTQLYLSSTTAGGYTSTKQYAPNHLVYVGVVTRSHVNQGSIEVRIQNGYEMDELHNVSAQTPADGHVLIYNDTTDLWESKTITAGTAIGITNGAGSITVNNTGVTSAVAGTGISVSGATGAVTVTNTGVTSLTGTANEIDISASTGSVTLSLPSSISVDLNGSVGATTPSTGSFTSLTDSGNLTFTGTGNRITGDFSNSTPSSRALFQTSTTNGASIVSVFPNGTSNVAAIGLFSTNDGENCSAGFFQTTNTDIRLTSSFRGTGTYLPMTFYTGGSVAMTIDTSQNVGIGTSSPSNKLQVSGNVRATAFYVDGAAYITSPGTDIMTFFAGGTERVRITDTGNLNIGTFTTSIAKKFTVVGEGNFTDVSNNTRLYMGYGTIPTTGGTGAYVYNNDNTPLVFGTSNTERMRIDSNGNVAIGTTTADGQVHIKAASGQGVPLTLTNTDAGGNPQVVVKGSRTYQIGTGNASSGFAGQLFFYDGTAAATRMLIDSSGNVGIGTTSPAVKLDVRGSSTYLINATSPTAWVSVDSALTTGSVYTQWNTSTNEGIFGSYTNHPIYFVTNNARRLTIDTSGNVGIGTTTIGAPLSIQAVVSTALALDIRGNSGDDGVVRFVNNAYSAEIARVSTDGASLIFGVGSSGTERVRIDSSGYTQFSSNLVMPYQGAPTSKAAAATLTGAELVTGILNTTGTTYTITLPTGTNIEGALTWAANNVSLDWTVINTASGTITIGANGNTTLGALTIPTATSAQFRIRRTAANTFTVYRMR